MVSLRGVLNLPPPAQVDPPPECASGAVDIPGWTLEPERRRFRLGRVLGKVLLFGAATVVMAVGVRSLVAPQHSDAPAPSTAAEFPTDASAIAARFATAYLTTQGDPAERTGILAMDVAPNAQVATDWHGTGTSRADAVLPADLHIADNRRSAWVSVLARVTTLTPRTSGRATQATRWVTLSVPLQAVGGRAVVSGTPAFVSMPVPGEIDQSLVQTPTDEAVTTATRDGAQAFFKAFGSSDAAAVEQATAPGAAIQPLGAGISLKSVDSWSVEEGSSSARTAHAAVTWILSGSTVQQSYRVGLIATSAGGTQAWRVHDIAAEIAAR